MEILIILLSPLLMSLTTFGLSYSGDDGMILFRIKESLRSSTDRGFFPSWLAKPLLLCSPCMNSIWGGVTYWIFVYFLAGVSWKITLVVWPFALFSAVTISILIESVHSHLKKPRSDGNPRRHPVIHNEPGLRPGSE